LVPAGPCSGTVWGGIFRHNGPPAGIFLSSRFIPSSFQPFSVSAFQLFSIYQSKRFSIYPTNLMSILSKLFSNAATPAAQIPGRGLTMKDRAAAYNRYRDSLNPVRGLTIARAVSLIESYNRGEFADLMWTLGAPYVGVESADADLMALIERRISPLLEMEWDARIVDPADKDTPAAKAQVDYVKNVLNNIDNLYGAIEHMAMASFRGFSLCEVVEDASGLPRSLNIVPQWCVVRAGSTGPWKYNPDARQTNYASLPPAYEIDPSRWLIRQVTRPIGRIALVKFVRASMSEKDWDGFLEIYGIPGGVVTLPADVPADKEDDYLTAAEDIAEGGHGALPNGSSYTPNDAPRGGTLPFRDRLKWLQEQLILAGTGGKLTMLAESGSGTLGGGAHADTFRQIAAGEARKISEIIQRQLIRPRLAAAFPGQKELAYFELSARQETDPDQVIKDIASLGAQFSIDPAQVEEKTGYKVTPRAPASFPPASAPFTNRSPTRNSKPETRNPFDPSAKFLTLAVSELRSAQAADNDPVIARLTAALKLDGPALEKALQEILNDLPDLAKKTAAGDATAAAYQKIYGAALASGLAASSQPQQEK
jgi:phage gp29-like protein